MLDGSSIKIKNQGTASISEEINFGCVNSMNMPHRQLGISVLISDRSSLMLGAINSCTAIEA